MSSLTKKVDFSFIRYANCWEDADVLLEAVAARHVTDALCIASAGDNALALLTKAGKGVYAIDVSIVQLCLTELKQIAIANLEYDEFLKLLGVRESEDAVNIYKSIKPKLSKAAAGYWDEHINIINKGVIHCGKFENYFRLFRKYFLPLAHGKKLTRQLLEHKTGDEQKLFYESKWNTLRWRWLMNIFFSKAIMGRYGRDPEFLKHVKLTVPEYIRQKTEAHIRSGMSTHNYFLHMIYTGNFDAELPFYLREENYEAIRSNIHKLTLSAISAEEAVKTRTFDTYCLSNIFEYYSDEDFKRLTERWLPFIHSGSCIAYWNLMAPRSFSEQKPDMFRMVDTTSLSAKDKGFFYSRFIHEERK